VQPAQGVSELVLKAGAAKARVYSQLRQHHPDLAFFKAEVALRLERLRLEGTSVHAAIGMAKEDATLGVLLDEQRSAVCGPMMAATEGQQVPELVAASLRAQLDVMQVQERRVSTARHLAAMLVAQQHRAPQRRRDGLFGASTWLRVSRARG
jgi:hypothetical protein